MFLMYADEADQDASPRAKHFIYGAAFIAADKAAALTSGIDTIRSQHGFFRGDDFKFKSRSRPEQVSADAHREAKAAALQCASDNDVVFCTYAVPHAIARQTKPDQLITWGANVLLQRFDRFCDDAGTQGLAMFDRMPVTDEFAYYRTKFTAGLAFDGGKKVERLDNILSFASTCNNASHLSSLADILVGSFRYCVNEETGSAASAKMFPLLVELMWKKSRNAKLYVRGLGLNFMPEEIKHPVYKADRDALIERLSGYLNPRE